MEPTELAAAISRALEGPTLVQKGREDRITNGTETLVSELTGSSRRCGGQGDVLSGAVGTFLAWGKNYEEREAKDEECVALSSSGRSDLLAGGRARGGADFGAWAHKRRGLTFATPPRPPCSSSSHPPPCSPHLASQGPDQASRDHAPRRVRRVVPDADRVAPHVRQAQARDADGRDGRVRRRGVRGGVWVGRGRRPGAWRGRRRGQARDGYQGEPVRCAG